jgi:predicted peptidase
MPRSFLSALACAALWIFVSAGAYRAQAQAPGSNAPAAAPKPNPAWPLYRHTGEQYRVYDFPGTGEAMPYRLFVPANWSPGRHLPMLVTLRAGTSVNNNYREGNDLVRVAAERGYIVVTPLGYRPYRQPYYNSPYPIAREPKPSVPGEGWTREEDERAEQDVMYVIGLVAEEYGVDPARIFIHGQNPSASGAMHLIEKYPDRFAAAVISSGPIVAENYPFERIRGKVALLIIHGDKDDVNPITASRALADAAKAAGIDASFAVVPGGTHLTAYLDYADEIYDFLDAHSR